MKLNHLWRVWCYCVCSGGLADRIVLSPVPSFPSLFLLLWTELEASHLLDQSSTRTQIQSRVYPGGLAVVIPPLFDIWVWRFPQAPPLVTETLVSSWWKEVIVAMFMKGIVGTCSFLSCSLLPGCHGVKRFSLLYAPSHNSLLHRGPRNNSPVVTEWSFRNCEP